LNAEKSPAVPFLPYPENLKGYIGDDIGFDPLRISDYFPMDYLRESELKYVFFEKGRELDRSPFVLIYL
jgi:hypothetical protein